MTVQVLKLTSGETVMADVIEDNGERLTVSNPIDIKTEISRSSKGYLVANQWLPMTEDNNIMYINNTHIVGNSEASDELLEYYIEAVEQILFPEKVREKHQAREEHIRKLYNALANNETIQYH